MSIIHIPPLPEGVCIEPLCQADRTALWTFSCANPDEPWTGDVEELIRSALYRQWEGAGGECQVIAAKANGELVGVAAFKALREEGLVYSWLIAVEHRWRRRGIGVNLKATVAFWAVVNGLTGIDSQVHKSNNAMIQLNQQWFNTITETDEDDPRYWAMMTAVASVKGRGEELNRLAPVSTPGSDE